MKKMVRGNLPWLLDRWSPFGVDQDICADTPQLLPWWYSRLASRRCRVVGRWGRYQNGVELRSRNCPRHQSHDPIDKVPVLIFHTLVGWVQNLLHKTQTNFSSEYTMILCIICTRSDAHVTYTLLGLLLITTHSWCYISSEITWETFSKLIRNICS